MFQQYESLTSDGCIFQFLSVLGRHHSLDVERFTNCAIGVSIHVCMTNDYEPVHVLLSKDVLNKEMYILHAILSVFSIAGILTLRLYTFISSLS